MNIKKRINARKIVLSYFYQHCFFSILNENRINKSFSSGEKIDYSITGDEKGFLDEAFLKKVADKKEEELHRDETVQKKIEGYAKDGNIEEQFSYILNCFFDQWSSDEVDVDYMLQVGKALQKYENLVIEKVNEHTVSFGYEKMDPMDQALLLLGYIEYKEIETPKEVVINEMVELAKRYADEGSPKLINGILHELFQELES